MEKINQEISRINEAVKKKINHPYTPIDGFEPSLNDKLNQYEQVRLQLQSEIDSYNVAVEEVKSLTNRLSNENIYIAYYEVENEIKMYEDANSNLEQSIKQLNDIEETLKKYGKELDELKAKKKNIHIAVDLINASLGYVFYAKNRLEIRVKGDEYYLYSYNRAVKPSSVSVGERNIIALCYFFVELLMNQEVKDGYLQKHILIIDDPISSFDYENRVGIMSFLRMKTADILEGNIESQILFLTHDIYSYYDLIKIARDVSEEIKQAYPGTEKLSFCTKELKNKKLYPFCQKKRNEYSELLKIIYRYACGTSVGDDYNIGNIMRRVLEAFSTFTYKKGIDQISRDKTITKQLNDTTYIEHFENLMYRLILNGDSHMEERTSGLRDIEYMSFLNDDERRRAAQEVICFLYLLNERHVLAHLEGEKDIKPNIDNWCSNIKDLGSSC